MKFNCRMANIDDEEHWTVVDAIDFDYAAEKYGQECDDNSAGELFNDPCRDEETVIVRDPDGVEKSFTVSFDYSKDFYAEEQA